jgi:hypothetical protein
VRAAIDADHKGDEQMAYDLYCDALEHFFAGKYMGIANRIVVFLIILHVYFPPSLSTGFVIVLMIFDFHSISIFLLPVFLLSFPQG